MRTDEYNYGRILTELAKSVFEELYNTKDQTSE